MATPNHFFVKKISAKMILILCNCMSTIVVFLLSQIFTVTINHKGNNNPTKQLDVGTSQYQSIDTNLLIVPAITTQVVEINSEAGEEETAGLTNFSEALTQTRQSFWTSIQPVFTCPKELLTKVGGPGMESEQGKWTCGLATLSEANTPCLVYSFGVAGDSHFEAEVLEKAGCAIYAYDPSVKDMGEPLKNKYLPQIHFQRLGIGNEDTGKMRTLKTLMQENGHKWIDILKMDVELAEYPALNTIMDDFPYDVANQDVSGLPFGQLLVEVHVWEWITDKRKELNKKKAKEVVSFLRRLEQSGLRMFHLEINPVGGGNSCSEFSFINVNPVSLKRFIGNKTLNL